MNTIKNKDLPSIVAALKIMAKYPKVTCKFGIAKNEKAFTKAYDSFIKKIGEIISEYVIPVHGDTDDVTVIAEKEGFQVFPFDGTYYKLLPGSVIKNEGKPSASTTYDSFDAGDKQKEFKEALSALNEQEITVKAYRININKIVHMPGLSEPVTLQYELEHSEVPAEIISVLDEVVFFEGD